VAGQLVRGLNEDARRQVELTVLRPPTFEQLGRTLHDAWQRDSPFHLVHFDGHGLYADPEAVKAQLGALPHYQEAIRLAEGSRDYYSAARTRYNVALSLLRADRRADALDYASVALQGFQRSGERAERNIDKVQALPRDIEG
jgi:hypothetical protein